MDQAQNQYNEKMAKHVREALEKRRMNAFFVDSKEKAKNEVLQMIPKNSTVFRCGSSSLDEMRLWEEISEIFGVELIDPFEQGISVEESFRRRVKGLSSDILISSANAVTMDGKIVNLDGTGNRVAAMAFGPQKVILVVGMNKIVLDVGAARERIRRYSAPANSIRLNLGNPCTETGLCNDCRSPSRICNIWSIIEGQMNKERIHVVLVGENLGY